MLLTGQSEIIQDHPLCAVINSGGVSKDSYVETTTGHRSVGQLVAGDILRSSEGWAEISRILVLSESFDWIGLPVAEQRSPIIVSSWQELGFRHFLCAALFGKSEVRFLAGDMIGSGLVLSNGSCVQLYLPVLIGGGVVQIGGYDFFFPDAKSFITGANTAAREDLLRPDEVRQLCDAGVLFRHGGHR